MNRFCLILVFLVLVCSAVMCFAIDNRVSEINEEVMQRIQMQDYELEEIKKNQRIVTQDIQFLENLVVEGKE